MDSLLQRMKALSSAEDFMVFFGIPYEERVVHVNRLHILKRFYQYLHTTPNLAADDEIELFRQYRGLLQRAYGDFVHSNAATEKVFKVFQESGNEKTVAVSSLRDSLGARRRAAAIAPDSGHGSSGPLQQAAQAAAVQQSR